MSKDGDVAVLFVTKPPVTALALPVRWGLKDHYEAALADDGVQAIVLRCDGGTFIAGADISEFGKPPRGPDFNAVLNTIEAATKPVVAAIHGTALGGGLETALVCHYRVARSEEHTSELQSLMRISYAVFCLKKKTRKIYE